MSKSLKIKLKRDQFMSARGGTATLFNIYCIRCRRWLLLYQKDGRGDLFRLYFDRIHAPAELASDTTKGLSCPHCQASIGIPMIYKPENRPALRLVPGAIVKKKSNGTLPAPETAEPIREKKGEPGENPKN